MKEFTGVEGVPCVKLKIDHFIPSEIFECGQCFRFDRIGDEYYGGVARGRYLRVKKAENEIIFENATADDINNIWTEYFDLTTDYGEIISELSRDNIIRQTLGAGFGKGIRILRQEPFETIISFIISQNNNIPRIKKIIGRLCEQFGKEINACGNVFHAFPNAEDIDTSNLSGLKSGFRDKYIAGFVTSVKNGDFDLDKPNSIPPLEEAAAYLQTIRGVGPKVSMCALLFGYGRLDAFPVDVWIRKAIEELYGGSSPKELFGRYAGVAQQYLFHYLRNIRGKNIPSEGIQP